MSWRRDLTAKRPSRPSPRTALLPSQKQPDYYFFHPVTPGRCNAPLNDSSSPQFSDYVVFVDESGRSTLKDIDPDFPLLVTAFLIVQKTDYANILCPALQDFKFRHFGHDQIILHERDIRRDLGAFSFLKSRKKKKAFIEEIGSIIAAPPVRLATIVIRKDILKRRYKYPENPYKLALEFGLERVDAFLRKMGAWTQENTPTTHVIVECRGKNEDNDLDA